MDMNAASPAKRRALAPLDANAMPSPRPVPVAVDDAGYHSPRKPPHKPLQHDAVTKRVPDHDHNVNANANANDDVLADSPSWKKARLERDEEREQSRSRSNSPNESSIFDSSAGDASWATALTEPDAVLRTRTMSTSTLTREQTRQRAEALRLRLRLAGYKVRTGQTTVSLGELEMQRAQDDKLSVTNNTSSASQSSNNNNNDDDDTRINDVAPSSSPPTQSQEPGQESDDHDDAEEAHTDEIPPSAAATSLPMSPEKASLLPLPRLSPSRALMTPQGKRLLRTSDEGEDGAGATAALTSSAVKGGAANGLLSLARGAC